MQTPSPAAVALQKAVRISGVTSTAFTFSVNTEQGSAALTTAVCRKPPPGKHHHKSDGFDDDQQQDLRYLALTFLCGACVRLLPPATRPLSKPGGCQQPGTESASLWASCCTGHQGFYPMYIPTYFISMYVSHRIQILDMSL